MGVGDYVHSREAGQPRAPDNGAAQSRQQRAEQARVDVPPTLVHPSNTIINGSGAALEFPGASQFPNQPRTTPAHALQRDVFDTDVEAIDDSTVTGTSVSGFEDNKSQAASSTNAAYTNPDPQPTYQTRPVRLAYGSNWYDGRGGQVMKTMGFDSDDLVGFDSPMTSDAGDDEKTDEVATGWQASHKSRTTEQPLSKRLESFWSQSKKRTSSRQPVNVDSDPERQLQPQPKPHAKPRKLGQMLPPTGARKVVLPPNGSATPRTRFSPPKPSLLEQLDQKLDRSPTRQNSQPPPELGRTLSITGFQTDSDIDGSGSDDGMDHTIRASGRRESDHSHNVFDMTSLTDLDADETMQDPFYTNASTINESTHEPMHEPTHEPIHASTRPRRNTVIRSKKRELEADYPPDLLYQKSFSELQAEPFEKAPTPPPPPVQSPPLPPKPSYIPDTQSPKNAVSHLLRLSEEERQAYLSQMSMDEWEDCGDQMIDQFTHLLSEMKNLRRARRRTAAVFEAEIKRRNDQVEAQTSELTNKLTEMRSGGAEVLRGRSQ
ncbi:hypothetical protein PENANT_c025G04935 [Penicillium antarcticum]|uniref:Extracellular mutant protein 11 C-terminal domain-containing protein n=1 Tax=Penicillium antarcticum TaxID=416450 RepID=A0A1V6PYL8_9EURO|nr:uncharacterized protein N7508_000354 [Penicillium antarcticum]KAJ5320071.1 hypothetical protein N7508_000354 [Penicillium antarcticum]OQD81802.1 hypothetical protein PENANT_c025G04935 [Penicillium antarcticum]